MAKQQESNECYVKGCGSEASDVCDRCGRPCCSSHAYQFTIQRRAETAGQYARIDASPHVPTYSETYTLCPQCKNKPIPIRLSDTGL